MIEYPRIDAFYEEAIGEWVAVNLDNPGFSLKADTLDALQDKLKSIGAFPYTEEYIAGLPGKPLDIEIPYQVHFDRSNMKRQTYRDMYQEKAVLFSISLMKKELAVIFSETQLENYNLWKIDILDAEQWQERPHHQRHLFKYRYWHPTPNSIDSSFVALEDFSNLICAYCAECETLRQIRTGVIPDSDLLLAHTDNLSKYKEIKIRIQWRIQKMQEIAPLAEERQDLRKKNSAGGIKSARTKEEERGYSQKEAKKLFDELLPMEGYTEAIKITKERLGIPRSTLGDWFPKKDFSGK